MECATVFNSLVILMRTDFSPIQMAKLRSTLGTTINNSAKLKMAVIATVDGMTVVSHGSQEQQDERLSAMCSSLYALGEAAVSDVSGGECTDVLIEGDKTTLMLVSVTESPTLVLMLVATPDIIIGELMYSVKSCVGSLKEIISNL
jgi:predicted regulator of Ras-like GTPase activity (Roadblock/LC7/MglB family)